MTKARKTKGKTLISVEIDDAVAKQVQAMLTARGTDVQTYIRLHLRSFTRVDTVLGLQAKMTFGKYLGELVEDVCRVNPGYVRWVITESTNVRFEPEVTELLEELA